MSEMWGLGSEAIVLCFIFLHLKHYFGRITGKLVLYLSLFVAMMKNDNKILVSRIW